MTINRINESMYQRINIMKARKIILLVLLMVFSWMVQAQQVQQSGNEFTIPLSDPAKRGKLKAHLNYGSITVKGSARKDILVKYSSAKGDEGDDDDDDHGKNKDKHKTKLNVNVNVNDGDQDKSTSKEGLKRISGGGLELEASENSNVVKVESGSWNIKTILEIEIPAGMDLDVSTYNDGD